MLILFIYTYMWYNIYGENMMKESMELIGSKLPEILILGSLPSELSLEKHEYYANPKNQFWNIISNVFCNQTLEFKTYNEKVKFLEKYNIALWDVINKADRVGSLDKNIKNETYNDIISYIDKNLKVKIFVNGKKAGQFLARYLKLNNRRDIEYLVLPSSSAANTRYSLENKIDEWRKYILDK